MNSNTPEAPRVSDELARRITEKKEDIDLLGSEFRDLTDDGVLSLISAEYDLACLELEAGLYKDARNTCWRAMKKCRPDGRFGEFYTRARFAPYLRIYFLLGDVFKARGDDEEAYDCYEKAVCLYRREALKNPPDLPLLRRPVEAFYLKTLPEPSASPVAGYVALRALTRQSPVLYYDKLRESERALWAEPALRAELRSAQVRLRAAGRQISAVESDNVFAAEFPGVRLTVIMLNETRPRAGSVRAFTVAEDVLWEFIAEADGNPIVLRRISRLQISPVSQTCPDGAADVLPEEVVTLEFLNGDGFPEAQDYVRRWG